MHYLQKLKFFQGLSPLDLDAIVQLARHCKVASEAFFFHQEEAATAFYVLTQGRVKLAQVTPEGHQVLVRFVGSGGGLGIVAALADAVYPLSAQAMEECQALAWDGQTLTWLMEHYPRLARNALYLLAERFKELQDRYRELATERVERRVAHALLRLVRQSGRKVRGGVLIDLPLSRQDLAEMTGTTLFTVSRILSRWDQQGFITAGRERVLIHSPHSLVAIAEDLPPNALP
jgi:CRP-like cAMP-binding protein